MTSFFNVIAGIQTFAKYFRVDLLNTVLFCGLDFLLEHQWLPSKGQNKYVAMNGQGLEAIALWFCIALLPCIPLQDQ